MSFIYMKDCVLLPKFVLPLLRILSLVRFEILCCLNIFYGFLRLVYLSTCDRLPFRRVPAYPCELHHSYCLDVFQEINDLDYNIYDCHIYDRQINPLEFHQTLFRTLCGVRIPTYCFSTLFDRNHFLPTLLSITSSRLGFLSGFSPKSVLNHLKYNYLAFQNLLFDLPIPGGCTRAGNFCSNYIIG